MDPLALLADPIAQGSVRPAVADVVGWLYKNVRNRFKTVPPELSEASTVNLDAFAECFVEQVVQRMRADGERGATLALNLRSPAGASQVERALLSAVEIDDPFTRLSLAALVARTMTSGKETRETLATEIAIDASQYLESGKFTL